MEFVISNCIDETIAANGNDAQILTSTKKMEEVILENEDESFLVAKSLGMPSGWRATRYEKRIILGFGIRMDKHFKQSKRHGLHFC